ncbi:hypothetical protein CRENBAI_007931 [Crenichthys baileyi]|uniref:Uncharacterized protein n=1 Tax=Crenichthys baileyi TaxID=28760 RepID=A0AAV9RSP3_9TELE
MRIKEVKSRLKQKEQGENGFTTPGSVVSDDDSTAEFAFSSAAVLRDEPQRTWDSHRPVTVHFGQTDGQVFCSVDIVSVGVLEADSSPNAGQQVLKLGPRLAEKPLKSTVIQTLLLE